MCGKAHWKSPRVWFLSWEVGCLRLASDLPIVAGGPETAAPIQAQACPSHMPKWLEFHH